MKLSTKGRYATRAMFDLAVHYENGLIHLKDISRRQEISIDYIEQLLRKLKNAGLVKSVKGPGGGYALARPPSLIKISEIIKAAEGPIALVDCVLKKEKCHRVEKCIARLLWKRLSEQIEKTLSSTTLEDLCKEAKELGL